MARNLKEERRFVPATIGLERIFKNRNLVRKSIIEFRSKAHKRGRSVRKSTVGMDAL